VESANAAAAIRLPILRPVFAACATALATVAGMVSESKGVQAGIRFLAEVVDPIAFMTELRKAEVEQTETLEQPP
jgi:hypothetical protein